MFKHIVILFNPNSTGDGEKNAHEFADKLQQKIKSLDVEVRATEYAGHAEEIAAEFARGKDKVLIISSSGDGGYHEVVNGILSQPHGRVVTAVLPSGNANDHYNATSTDSLIKNIVTTKTKSLDAIEIKTRRNGKNWTRYAHSYVGFGLTPTVGRELNRTRLTLLNEKWYVVRHMLRFRYVKLSMDGRVARYTSVVFATIDRMAKVVKLGGEPDKHPGKMSLYTTEYQPLWKLLNVILKASVKGLDEVEQTQDYRLKTVNYTPVQLDGEVFTVDRNSEVKITCKKGAIKTVL